MEECKRAFILSLFELIPFSDVKQSQNRSHVSSILNLTLNREEISMVTKRNDNKWNLIFVCSSSKIVARDCFDCWL